MAETTSRDGTPVHYTVAGDGPCLCLVHGLGGAAVDWRAVVVAFRDRFRLLTVDWRGHGQSHVGSSNFSVLHYVDDVLAALDAAGFERCHLLGHSIGGGVVQEITVQYSERVQSLILADTTDWFGDHDEPGGSPPFVPPALAEMSARRSGAWSDEIRRALWRALVDWPGVRDRLPTIACPTLVVHGERDASRILEGSERLQRAIPGARREVIPNAGHSPHLEEPDAFNDALSAHLASVAAS